MNRSSLLAKKMNNMGLKSANNFSRFNQRLGQKDVGPSMSARGQNLENYAMEVQ